MEESQLHVFCDAGANAFGAAMWLETPAGISFVQAKTMVAPLKTRTIPRLELLAAQLASRMIRSFHSVFGSLPTTVWTDSKVVLGWLNIGARKFKAFVSARLQEIHENIEDANVVFRHIPGKRNPADVLSKPVIQTRGQLMAWLEGPDFLHDPRLKWLDEEEGLSSEEEKIMRSEIKTDKTKKKKKPRPRPHTLKTTVNVIQEDLESEASKARSWGEFLVSLAKERSVTIEEALNISLKHAQYKLEKKGPKKDEHGIVRMEGRLGNSGLTTDIQHPILLDGESAVTLLLVRQAHEDCGHAGQKYLKNFLHSRRGVRVTGAKSIFRRIKEGCETCRKMFGKAHAPLMGELPPERLLARQAPFTAIGIDFAGPLPAKGTETVEVLLFTCLTTRVVHLEVTLGKTTVDVVKAWKRFLSRRGVEPRYVLSDGARSFKQAKEIIEKSYKVNPVYGTLEPFRWEVSHPRAPHRRGAIEILVKIFKRALKTATEKRKDIEREEWENIISEVNFIMNERPLIDGIDPLKATAFTGNSILHPYKMGNCPSNANNILEGAHQLTKQIWEEWYTNAVPEKFDRKKWKENLPNIKVGDRVMIVKQGYGNFALPRKYWPTGTVCKCFLSNDNVVRKVVVMTDEGKNEHHVVQNLVIICEGENDKENSRCS